MRLKVVNVYYGMIVFMGVLLIVFAISSHKNYMDLLNVNEQLSGSLSLERTDKEEFRGKYRTLYDKYEDLKAEYIRYMDISAKTIYDFTEAEVELIALCVEA